MFIFDESSSIGTSSFRAAVRFAKEVVEAQVNGTEAGCVRAAGIGFSHEARRFSGLTNARRLLATAEAFPDDSWLANGISPRGGPTGTRCGLSEAERLLVEESRPSCRKVIFLLTDGHHNWCGHPEDAAKRLKCTHCAEIFVIGLGSDVSTHRLSDIASKKKKQHLFLLRRFADLHQLGAAFLHRRVHL